MFERYTDRARRVAVLAGEEARNMGCAYIGTEHLLLGLVVEGEAIAAQALATAGAGQPEVLRHHIGDILGNRERVAPSGHIPYTPRAKKVLELALREALQLGHNYVGAEHILLGLIREGEGIACQALAVRLSVDLAALRTLVINKMATYGEHSGGSQTWPASYHCAQIAHAADKLRTYDLDNDYQASLALIIRENDHIRNRLAPPEPDEPPNPIADLGRTMNEVRELVQALCDDIRALKNPAPNQEASE